MSPNPEMCKGCYYWKSITCCGKQGYMPMCCHHLLWTGERWKRGENGCESKTLRRRVKR